MSERNQKASYYERGEQHFNMCWSQQHLEGSSADKEALREPTAAEIICLISSFSVFHSLGRQWLVRCFWRVAGCAYIEAYKLRSGLGDEMLLKRIVRGTVACSGHAAVFVKGCCRTSVSAWDCIHSNDRAEIIFLYSWKSHSFVSWEVGCNGLMASGGKMPALSCGCLWMKCPGKTLRSECYLHRGKGYLPSTCWLSCNKLETGGIHSSLSPLEGSGRDPGCLVWVRIARISLLLSSQETWSGEWVWSV